MTDATRILSNIEQGNTKAAEQLLPLIYDELRKLAAQNWHKRSRQGLSLFEDAQLGEEVTDS